MDTCSTALRLRCLLVWVAVTAVGLGLVLAVSADLHPGPGAGFDRVLVALASWALSLAAAWASAATGAVALETVRAGSGTLTVRRLPGVPAPAQRLVLRACGAALAGGLVAGIAATPSTATPGSLEGRQGTTLTSSARVPQAPPPPAGPVSTGPVAHAVRTALPAPRAASVTSRPGDSLWRLAEADLRARTGREPTDAEVAAHWPRLHATNRVLLGPDPDFLLPGVPIRLPAPTPDEIQEHR